MARKRLTGDPDHQTKVALEVVATVKRFRPRLNPDRQHAVDTRLAELERAIAALAVEKAKRKP